MAECEHSQHWSLDECPGLTPEEVALGEKVRSVALNFVGCAGREDWHGPTVKERTNEMFANAKKYGNEPPQYEGRAVLR
jgi:hypothetical protein